jgi:hypothetical protein
VKQSVRLGRIGGITVGAHWSVAVILVIIAQVLADGRVTGMVTVRDLQHALRRRAPARA